MGELMEQLNRIAAVQQFSNFSSPTTSKLYNSLIYEPFYARLCPYLCGMMTAYFLHTKPTALRIPKQLHTILWLTSISIIFAIIIGTFSFHSVNNLPSKFINSFFISGSHFGWSISIAFIIFSCHSGEGGFVNSFLSMSLWKPISKVGLSIYVTNILAILAIFGTQKQPEYFNEFLVTHLYVGDLGLSFGIAVIAFLTFEASVLSIEKSFHSKKTGK
jgi:hypothetical protein